MAQLVFGGGTSHTPMLNCAYENWLRFEERDRLRKHVDLKGRLVTIEEMRADADPAIARDYINPASFTERYKQTHEGIAHMKRAIAEARLDALVIVGDDQQEIFHNENMPAFAVYCGTHIRNEIRENLKAQPPAWFGEAQRDNLEPKEARDYPVADGLAKHMIAGLVGAEFDISTSQHLLPGVGEGHAVGFVHRHLLGPDSIPVVPVFINTYYPPNQPSAARCYKLGRALSEVIAAYPENLRVGILASGGLSHFVVDEALDRDLIAAMDKSDAAMLCGIPEHRMQMGTSEIRNWICVAGAMAGRRLGWVNYIPGYRTSAGTGIGICFAQWEAAT
jgi:3-O-methylgallate 3,4-dioxygenase